ncbi:MAG: alanine racemase [Spirochaetaceae bacterium]|nr:MAG: alanine racemase [Spirochaetaceae bacterium]
MRATVAAIHLSNLRHNLREIRSHLDAECAAAGRKPPAVCVAVKADAYGHGAGAVARVAVEEGITHLGVATVDEGAELRDAGIAVPILLYGPPASFEYEKLVQYQLSPFVASIEYGRSLSLVAQRLDMAVAVHLKVDTGMGRYGCTPEAAPEIARQLSALPRLVLAGTATHFPLSDGPDNGATEQQWQSLQQVAQKIRAAGVDPGLVHAANSGAIVAHPHTWGDMVRPGISVYGYYPSTEQERPIELKPVMELGSRLSFVKRVPKGATVSYGMTWTAPRETVIGTVPAGYADGINRGLSSRGEVLVHEAATGRAHRVPIVGRVCMDQFMVDLGPESQARVEDRVVLFGPDPAGPSAEDIAVTLGTIPYEVTCWVSRRVPRVFRD